MMKIEQLTMFQQRVRTAHPLVHCITNTVTIWDCANMLLAAGASPTMAHHPEEVAEITAACQALVCNLGAMENFDAMLAAAPVATKLGHPLVVDPVGAGGSSFRRARFKELAQTAPITCVRGNGAEIIALAKDCATVTGVDSPLPGTPEAFAYLKEMAMQLSQSLSKLSGQICIVIASGAVDILTDGNRIEEIVGGDPMMSRITGSGCMLSALLGAYLAVEPTLEGAVAAVTTMGLCGERAAKRTREEQRGTMTFHTHLIDEMSML